MEASELEEIQAAIVCWADRNFGDTDPLNPLEGLIEEIGEIAHSRVKRRQKIRGTVEGHIAAERDAIGDAGIFLLHFTGKFGLCPSLYLQRIVAWSPAELDRKAFAMLVNAAARLLGVYSAGPDVPPGLLSDEVLEGGPCPRVGVATALVTYADVRGWDFGEILRETWAKVSKRDWVADPVGGGEGPGHG